MKGVEARYCLILVLTVLCPLSAAAQQPVLPAAPRIVSLHDTALTIPLIDLGVIPVGSHGRIGPGGQPFLRSGALVTGLDFANSSVALVGDDPADLGAIAALSHDLILTTSWQSTGLRQLQQIAPTEVIAFETLPSELQVHDHLPKRLGRETQLRALKDRHATQIALLRASVADPAAVTVNVILPSDGQLRVWHSYCALGRVLGDAGFVFPTAVDAIPGPDAARLSTEMLPQMDAEVLFIPYLDGDGQDPQATARQLEEVMPDWCNCLKACREGRVIWVPRLVAGSASYAAMAQMTQGRRQPCGAARRGRGAMIATRVFCRDLCLARGEPLAGSGTLPDRILLLRGPRGAWRSPA